MFEIKIKSQIKFFIILAVLRRSVMSWQCQIRVFAPRQQSCFEEMSQRCRVVGNTVSDLTGPRFELQISCSRDKRVIAQPTG